MYDKFMEIFEGHYYHAKEIDNKMHSFVCGALSGVIASSSVYPLENMW